MTPNPRQSTAMDEPLDAQRCDGGTFQPLAVLDAVMFSIDRSRAPLTYTAGTNGVGPPMKRTTGFLTLCCVVTFTASGASGAEGHFYGGVSIGRSSVDGRAQAASNIFFAPTPPTSISINSLPFDDSDTAWSGFVGYSATQYVGIELGYWDHGTFRSRLLGPDKISLGIKEWSFGATVRYPLTSRLALTGGAGVSRAQFDVDGSITVFTLGSPTIPSLPVFPLPPTGIFPPGVIFVPGAPQQLALTSPKDETGGYWKVGLNWRFSDAIEAGLSCGKRDLQVERVESLALSLSYAF